jgi:hypothetical protein
VAVVINIPMWHGLPVAQELAKLCIAARPVLWAIAIIAVLIVGSILVPN